jgi:hypothetical protein
MNRASRKSLNRLLAVLGPLAQAAQQQTARRERAQLLRAARALRTVKPGRPVVMSQAEIALARTAPIGRHVVRDAYDMPPTNRAVEDLLPSWEDWDRWTYGGYDGSFTGIQFAKARNGPLKREVWNLFRRGMTAEQIARTLTYTIEFPEPKDRPENATMFASPQWVQSVLDEAIELVKRKNGIQ